MSWLADPSILFSVYFARSGTPVAAAILAKASQAPLISALTIYEFSQAVWLEAWLARHGRRPPFPESIALSGLANFELDRERGAWETVLPAWESVFGVGEELSRKMTPSRGIRSMDLLHIATALEVGAEGLLSLDAVQRSAAEALGLKVLPA